MLILELLVLSIVLLTAIAVLFYIWVNASAKAEVKVAPRKPMAECPKHGMFFQDLMLQIEVPTAFDGGQPLKVDCCPFCYDERSRNADAIIKRAKQGKL